MDDYKKILHSCGVGGIKCKCCQPRKKKNKKDRKHNRSTRRKLKQVSEKQNPL
jgi:hypothetical protein